MASTGLLTSIPETSAARVRTILAMVAAACTIFVLDVWTDAAIVVAVLYVAVVLMAGRVFERRFILILTLVLCVLTVLGAWLSPGSRLDVTVFANRVLALMVIGTAALLVLRDQSTQKALRQGDEKLNDARQQLAHLNRVATMGQLTASIAHEVKQPIGAAVTNAEAALNWLGDRPPDLEEARQALACIVKDGSRAGEIIDRIRAQVQKLPPASTHFNVNEAVNELIALTRSEVEKHEVKVRISLAEGLSPVLGDRVQLQQVVLNLILNAVEAMSSCDDAPREVSIRTEQRRAGEILVAISDSGPGIDPERLERVFDSFYTTKPNGMGLGLSICRSIVADHGGQLWAGANEPRGAVFQFTLPANRELQ